MMNPDTTVLIAEDDDGHAALIEKTFLRDEQETLDYFLVSGNVQLEKSFDHTEFMVRALEGSVRNLMG
jgi:hypothetical protein